MQFIIQQNKPIFAVFSYEFERRIVFVGHGKLADLENFGKFCPILDIEFQRRLGDGQYPHVQTTVLQLTQDETQAGQMAELMHKTLNAVWSDKFDTELDKLTNPHVLHVESGAVFSTPVQAANALNIRPAQAYNSLNNYMFTGPKPGPKQKNHIVSTSRKPTHDPKYLREAGLAEWREQHGFAKYGVPNPGKL